MQVRGRIADQYRVYRTFEDARKYVHSLKLKNQGQWNNWCRSGRKPNDIPARPNNTYKDQWQSWGDWLCSKNVEQEELVQPRRVSQPT